MQKKLHVTLSDYYQKALKAPAKIIRFEKSAKKAGDVQKAKNKLRTIAKNAVKDLENKLNDEQKNIISERLEIYHQIIRQTQPKTLYYIEKDSKKSLKDYGKIIGNCYRYFKKFNIDVDNKLRTNFMEHVDKIKNKKGKGKKKFIKQEIEKIAKIAESVLNALIASLSEEQKESIAEKIKLLQDIFNAQKQSRKNLCSIHEPGVACIPKGKCC